MENDDQPGQPKKPQGDAHLSGPAVDRPYTRLEMTFSEFTTRLWKSLYRYSDSIIILFIVIMIGLRLIENWPDLVRSFYYTEVATINPLVILALETGPIIIGGLIALFTTRVIKDFGNINSATRSILKDADKVTSALRRNNSFKREPRKDGNKALETTDPRIVFIMFRERMLLDGARLSSLSLRNLTFGILFSVAALTFIGYPLIFGDLSVSLQNSEDTATTLNLINTAMTFDWATRYYLPRFGVGLILQFVGFFFLRLYVSNENDIKYNKNEITNMEAKFLAYAIVSGEYNESMLAVVSSLTATERNFILKKGERVLSATTDERFNDLKSILESIMQSLPKAPPAKTG